MRNLLVAALLLTGCASAGLDARPEAEAVDGIDTLVGYLEGRGFTLEPAGLTTSTVPITAATTYRVTGLASPVQLEMFEFGSADEAERGLALLRTEIRPRVHQEVYLRGPLVVYARAERARQSLSGRLRRALSEALGSPRGGA